MKYIFFDFPVPHVHRCLDNGDVLSIPFDEATGEYQAYLAWLAEGNTPEPWEATNGPE